MKLHAALLSLAVLALPLASTAAAQRVVSLAGEATEVMYALGVEDLLVAVDATSNYPAAALELPNVGYAGRLSSEAVLAYEPDVVLANNTAGPQEVLDQLEAAGVRLVYLGTAPTLDTPVENVRLVASLFGQEERGEELVAELQAKLAQASAWGQQLDPAPRVLFLYLGSRTAQFAGGADTASNAMITAAGAVDVGAEIGYVGNVPYTPEAVLAAAPDVIIVTERGMAVMGSVEAVLELPGIAGTPAAERGNVLVFEDLYFLGLGLRSGDALTELVDYLYSVR